MSVDEHFLTVVEQIRGRWTTSRYDHKLYLPDLPRLEKWRGDEAFRRTYAAFKFSVADVLKPKSIVEVGVGFAVAARAFLFTSPNAWYVGYDDGSMDPRAFDVSMSVLKDFDARIMPQESSKLTHLPACDFCHVDGAHDYGHAYHDTMMALRAAKWVLVDDCRDSQVAAAVMQAIYCWRPGDVAWCYFEDTRGGDILIWTGAK